jgi:hypothetical protein
MPGGREYCEVEEDFFPSAEFKVIDKVRYHLPGVDESEKHRPIKPASSVLPGLAFVILDAIREPRADEVVEKARL